MSMSLLRAIPGLLLLALILLSPSGLRAAEPTVADILSAGLAAHGDDQADGTVLTLDYEGETADEGQSRAVFGPFETYPTTARIVLDRPNRTLSFQRGAVIAGDFDFHGRTVLRGGRGFSYDIGSRTVSPTAEEPRDLELFLPGRLLKRLAAAPETLSLGAGGDDGTVRLVETLRDGRQRLLAFDAVTGLLLWQEVPMPAFLALHGATRQKIVYSDYRSVGGLRLPGRVVRTRTSEIHGEVPSSTHRLVRGVAAAEFRPGELDVPAGTSAVAAAAEPFALRSLDSNVHVIVNPGEAQSPWYHNTMFIVLADHVLVVEAVGSGAVSEKVLEKVRAVAPGKPVRHLVQSHHHMDHIGGIRPYIAEGATVVVPPGVGRLVGMLPRITPPGHADRLSHAPREASVLEVADSWTGGDGETPVQVFNIADDPHAGNMLVTWLPKQRVLFQSDLVNPGIYPDNATTAHFVRWLKAKGLDVQTMVGSHGPILDRAGIEALLARH